jgi:hypothetical protein
MIRAFKTGAGAAMLALCVFAISKGYARSKGVDPGIEHAREMKVRPDGAFDVTCIDGETEVRTQAEVQAGRVCTHIVHRNGVWTLVEGGVDHGMRMCDMQIDLLTGKNKVLNISAGFAAPCGGEVVKTEECNGLVCNINIGEVFYSMDFTTSGRMELIRLKDGFRAVYKGEAGLGQTNARVRTTTLNGIDNILQASNDNGSTWLSVCDDEFSQEDAAVACREMGFSGVQNYDIAISVANDEIFGLDNVDCDGTEASIFDCRHQDWGVENCADYEHVQLTCN